MADAAFMNSLLKLADTNHPRSVLNPRGASRLPVGLPELNIEDEATGRETELRHVIA